jgi:hypothetical protein
VPGKCLDEGVIFLGCVVDKHFHCARVAVVA